MPKTLIFSFSAVVIFAGAGLTGCKSDPGDPPEETVAIDLVREFEAAEPFPAPSLPAAQEGERVEPSAGLVAETSHLTLPFGSRVRFFSSLPPDAVLRADSIVPFGAHEPRGARLEVFVRPIESPGDPSRSWKARPDPSERSFDLRVEEETAAVLTIRAYHGELDEPQPPGGMRLFAPRILAPPRQGSRPPTDRPALEEPPNILVYMIDTLRADHLGSYGYPRPVSPNIDRLAEEGTLFRRAYASASWTRPSVASVLTGLRPTQHGVNGNEDRLGESLPTVGELLARHGYRSVGFTTNGNVHPNFGFGEGFDRYEHVTGRSVPGRPFRSSHVVNTVVESWLEERGEEPFFLFAHTVDPHSPYQAEAPWDELFAAEVEDPSIGAVQTLHAFNRRQAEADEATRQDLLALYDAEIAANDHSFGVLVERLQEAGLYDEMMIVVVSDHGEEFGDHGRFSHGLTLYEEQLHVPLIVKWPRSWQAGTEVKQSVELVDLVPTILDLLGEEEVAEALPGRSLLPLVAREGSLPPDLRRRPAFAHLDKDRRKIHAVTSGRFKLIEYPESTRLRFQLYDLETDAGETTNRVKELPLQFRFLRARLQEAHSEPGAHAETVEIDAELRAELEALGYLQ